MTDDELDDGKHLSCIAAIKSLSLLSLTAISACADAVTGWNIRNDLLLNPTKTKELDTGTRLEVAKLDQSHGVPVFGVDVPFVSKLRVLGVALDCHLTPSVHKPDKSNFTI